MSNILEEYKQLSKSVEDIVKTIPKIEAERDLAKKEANKLIEELAAMGITFATKEDIPLKRSEIESRVKNQMDSLQRKLQEYTTLIEKQASIATTQVAQPSYVGFDDSII